MNNNITIINDWHIICFFFKFYIMDYYEDNIIIYFKYYVYYIIYEIYNV